MNFSFNLIKLKLLQLLQENVIVTNQKNAISKTKSKLIEILKSQSVVLTVKEACLRNFKWFKIYRKKLGFLEFS